MLIEKRKWDVMNIPTLEEQSVSVGDSAVKRKVMKLQVNITFGYVLKRKDNMCLLRFDRRDSLISMPSCTMDTYAIKILSYSPTRDVITKEISLFNLTLCCPILKPL